jgi:hypothetical protein
MIERLRSWPTRRLAVVAGCVALIEVAVLWVVLSGSTDESDASHRDATSPPSIDGPAELTSFLDAARLLHAGGALDCAELADGFATSLVVPERFLVALEVVDDGELQELLSATEINVVDGLAACEAGNTASAAIHFAAVAEGVQLIDQLLTEPDS